MKKRITKEKNNLTAKKMLIKTTLIFLIPFFLFIGGIFLYNMFFYKARMVNSSQEMINMYQTNLEEEISRVDAYLLDQVANDTAYECLQYENSQVETYLRIYELKEKMESVIKSVGCIDALYIMPTNTDVYGACYSGILTYDEKNLLVNYFKEITRNKGDDAVDGWNIRVIGDKKYFVRIIGKGGVYCISVIDIDTLFDGANGAIRESSIVFSDGKTFISSVDEMEELKVNYNPDKEYYISGTSNNRWLIVQNLSEKLNCNILLISRYEEIWKAEITPIILLVAVFIFVLLLVFCYKIIKKELFLPMDTMVETMEKISSGELDSKLSVNSRVKEYKKVEETFNQMIARVRKLKIIAYDREIQIQKTQLEYYHIQIRPHFFLNCLKNLYALSATKQIEKMQDLILTMSDYLRFVFQDHSATLPIQKELECVEAYMKIQKINSAKEINLSIDVDKDLLDFKIPPLSIITFVEIL